MIGPRTSFNILDRVHYLAVPTHDRLAVLPFVILDDIVTLAAAKEHGKLVSTVDLLRGHEVGTAIETIDLPKGRRRAMAWENRLRARTAPTLLERLEATRRFYFEGRFSLTLAVTRPRYRRIAMPWILDLAQLEVEGAADFLRREPG